MDITVPFIFSVNVDVDSRSL